MNTDSSRCQFCAKHVVTSEDLPVKTIGGIFEEPHEGAYFGECQICGQYYLVYWVEYRDEILDYYCPISNEEFVGLEARRAIGYCEESEIRDLIKKREVLFKSPRQVKWTNGSEVLLEGRPW